MANGQLNLGMRCIKYLLFAVNSLFVLTGVMIISVGTTIYAVYDDFSNILQPSYASPATILIIVGILVFIIAFFGCCGAIKESTCMVLVFAVSLSVILILELAAVMTAYSLRNQIIYSVEMKLSDLMHQYPTNKECQKTVDLLQENLQCCGVHDYSDWRSIDLGNYTYPASCCDRSSFLHDEMFSSDISEKCPSSRYITQGCYRRLALIVNRSALYIGTAALAIILVQLTGIMFACVLGRAIRRQKTERERRRWELRENLINGYQPIGKSDPLAAFPVVYMQPSVDPAKSSIIS